MSTSHRFTNTTTNTNRNQGYCPINHEHCPLTPALRQLLEASVVLGTTNNKVLAEYLFCSEETVKSGFRRISVTLDTHSRTETLLRAIMQGWINPSPEQ
jgi:DNA-binding NarL/FixJ family response regulator